MTEDNTEDDRYGVVDSVVDDSIEAFKSEVALTEDEDVKALGVDVVDEFVYVTDVLDELSLSEVEEVVLNIGETSAEELELFTVKDDVVDMVEDAASEVELLPAKEDMVDVDRDRKVETELSPAEAEEGVEVVDVFENVDSERELALTIPDELEAVVRRLCGCTVLSADVVLGVVDSREDCAG